jgi:hypothetical protein
MYIAFYIIIIIDPRDILVLVDFLAAESYIKQKYQ